MFQSWDELKHIGEDFKEACILDLILEGLSDEYKSIKFATERDPKISLKYVEITMRYMYANCVTRRDGSTFLHRMERESAMAASLDLKGSCE